jgi:hypothetical protein
VLISWLIAGTSRSAFSALTSRPRRRGRPSRRIYVTAMFFRPETINLDVATVLR